MSPKDVALLLFSAAWLLPAGTSAPSPRESGAAAGNPTLNLAAYTLDEAMKRRLPGLLAEELEESPLLGQAWDQAKETWMETETQPRFPETLRALCRVAVLADTLEEAPLYAASNAATRTAWGTPQAYAAFPFKALHLLLSRAAKTLGPRGPACAKADTGTVLRFSVAGLFRFGQFTSATDERREAREFGQATFSVLLLWQAFPVGNLSRFPGERKAVVPPCEMFRVTAVQGTPRKQTVPAMSAGVCSNHNWGQEGTVQ